ncbi:hypothetical protein FH972_006895 [Carpinus fangiana]|uniref:HMA domain-containing protein n=1 Tax=Carpinus fangiana TaxID=176857 RepID=A0A5N6QVI5_9ROSI|nr:hypothetical protein FH972_006895 [Carpinus fangiana]
MVQRTVLKVDISCLKCKKKLFKAVSALQGVDKVEADAAKGTLTVTGDADPYEIIVRARKVGKFAEVVSIGPPPAPPKKPDPKIEVQIPCMPHNCLVCEREAMVPVGRWDEPNPPCSIL